MRSGCRAVDSILSFAALACGIVACALPHHGRRDGAGPTEDAIEVTQVDAEDDAAGDACATTPDLPDPDSTDTNCDGIDGDASRAVFVSTTGNDASDGSRAHPVATLRGAFARVTGSGGARGQVLVFHGEYDGHFDVPSNVSVAGGYCDDGSRDLTACTTTLRTPMPSAVRLPGSSHVLLEGLTITSGNATTAGDSSVALRVIGGSDVTLSRVETHAGRGAAGVDAMPGATGATGGSGTNGSGRSSPGAGGTSTCGAGVGGAGGAGAGASVTGSSGSDGAAGSPVGTLPGGVAGGHGAGYAGGGDGGPGSTGIPGDHGVPPASMVGVDRDGIYRVVDGATGHTGGHGSGGGGGGGGGSSTFYDSGSGGGGGAGGCGGDGGGAGTGGGGSFGVVIVGTRAVRIAGCAFHAGDGGVAGAGAIGGVGGPGGGGGSGAGGDGGAAGGGGHGGAGGPGGQGGCGTGGTGGPSIGALFSSAELVTTGFTAHEAMGGAGGAAPSCGAGGSLVGANGIAASQLTSM